MIPGFKTQSEEKVQLYNPKGTYVPNTQIIVNINIYSSGGIPVDLPNWCCMYWALKP